MLCDDGLTSLQQLYQMSADSGMLSLLEFISIAIMGEGEGVGWGGEQVGAATSVLSLKCYPWCYGSHPVP